MAKKNSILGPTLGTKSSLQEAPLGRDLLPVPEQSLGPTLGDIKLPDAPILRGVPDIMEFTPEESRRRDVARKYGVQPFSGINIEESAGLLQSNFSKWTNGILKGVGTAGTTFLEPFVDLLVGTPNAVATGNFSGFYTNEAANTLDGFNEYLRTELPNYYTQAEQDYGFWRSLGTANFWADQGMQGLGFLAGAIGSGYVTGASGVIKSLVRAPGMAGIRAWRNITNSYRTQQVAKTASELAKARDLIGRVNYSAQAANMWGAGIISAFGEAGIEARETKRLSTETMQNLRYMGDERYANMSDEEIDQLSDTAANTAFGLNTALVSASNLYQFGKLFSRTWKSTSNKYLDDLVQKKAVDGKLRYEFKEMPKNWKKYHQAANWFKRPAAEAFEEWSQAAINVAAEDYFESVYTPTPVTDLADFLEGGVGAIGSLFRGYVEAPQTKEGQQAIFLGALLGKLGEAGSALKEDGKTSRQEWLDTYDRTANLVEELNLLEPESKLYKLLQGYNQSIEVQKKLDKALEAGDIFEYKNLEAGGIFNIIDTFIRAGKQEDLKAFVRDIGSLSEEEFKEVIGIDLNAKIKSPAEQARMIEDRIKTIENEKAKIDLFISTLEDVTDEEKAILNGAIRYYSYMGDIFDKREIEMAAELLEVTDGKVNWTSFEGLKGKELAKAMAEAQVEYQNSGAYTQINGNQSNFLLQELGKIQTIKGQYNDLLNKIVDDQTLSKVERLAKRSKEDAKVNTKDGDPVREEVQDSKDQDLVDAVEDEVETTAKERKLRPEQIGTKRERKLKRRQKELEDQLNATEEENKAAVQAALDEVNEAIQAKVAKASEQAEQGIEQAFAEAFPKTAKEKQRAKEEEDELQRLVEAEERGVDLDTSENKELGNLLAYPNASLDVRFLGQEGMVFKEEDGTVIFRDKEGKETVVGKFLDTQTPASVGIEVLEDQSESSGISIVADGRTFEIAGNYYNNLFINPLSAIDPFIFRLAQPGYEAKRVTLFDSEGNKVTFTNPYIVQELSRLITMMELVKQEAISEMQDFDAGLMEFEFQGDTYFVEDIIQEGQLSLDFEGKRPNVIVYNKNLNKLRSPKKVAKILQARDQFIENYLQNKINAYIQEYEEDINGAQPDAAAASRSEEDVKRDAQESSRERVSPKDIGDDRPAPDKTDKQAAAKPKQDELDRGQDAVGSFVTSTEALDELGIDLGTATDEELGLQEPIDTQVSNTSPTVKDAKAPIINTEESKDAVNDAVEQGEIPENTTVSSTNFDANKNGSDILGAEIVPLKTIRSIAWKSANHPDNKGVTVEQRVQELTDIFENNINHVGAKIEFTIDLNDPQLTDIREMQPILAKLKKGQRLTEEEVGKVAIKATLTFKDSSVPSVFGYVHRDSYIDQHIDPEQQEAAKQMLKQDRTLIYENYLAGNRTVSEVEDMTGGHLVTEKGSRNKLTTLLTSPQDRMPRLYVASNDKYVDSNNKDGFAERQLSPVSTEDKNLEGAIFTALVDAKGERFPLRVYVANLSEEAAGFVYSIYLEAIAMHNGNINKNMNIKTFNAIKEKATSELVKSFIPIIESIMPSQEVGPTYKQILDMFIFQGAKTKSRVSPTIVAGRGKLRIGNKEYTSEQLKASRTEIIDWLMTNKKHNVAKMYINEGSSTLEKSMNGKYNKWLIDNSIVYTDAVATTKNKSAFIQPTLRYSAARTEEKVAPAEKVSVSPDQVRTPVSQAEFNEAKKKYNKLKKEAEDRVDQEMDAAAYGTKEQIAEIFHYQSIMMRNYSTDVLKGMEKSKKEKLERNKKLAASRDSRKAKKAQALIPFLQSELAQIQNVIAEGVTPAEAKAKEAEAAKPKGTDLTKLTGGFQTGLTSADLAGLGIEIPSVKDAFDIDTDFGAPTPIQKSDITKSQEDQNCK